MYAHMLNMHIFVKFIAYNLQELRVSFYPVKSHNTGSFIKAFTTQKMITKTNNTPTSTPKQILYVTAM